MDTQIVLLSFAKTRIKIWLRNIFDALLKPDNLALTSIFILFFAIRLFSKFKYIVLGGDSVSYLALARSFPWHKLYNNELYLIHPPLFGYMIGIVQYFLPLFQAGLFVSLLFAVLTFFALIRYARISGLDFLGISIALLYISINGTVAAFDSHINRVSILVFFIAMSLSSFSEYLKDGKKSKIYLTFIFNSLCLISSDQGLAVLPCQFIQLLLSGQIRLRRNPFIFLFVSSIAVYSIWPLVRLYIYMTRDFYPAGIDGMVEFFSPISIKSVLQPNYLPFTNMQRAYFTSTDFSLRNLDLLHGFLRLPVDLLFIPKSVSILIIACLSLIAIFNVFLKKDKKIFELILLALILYFPCFFRMNIWYGMCFVIPFSIILGKTVSPIFKYLMIKQKTISFLIIILSIFLTFTWLIGIDNVTPNTSLWPVGGTHFLFTRIPVTRGAQFTKDFPDAKDACSMAPVTLVPEMLYLKGGRWIALPFDPSLLEPLIQEYNVKYIVITDEFLTKTNDQYLNIIGHFNVVDYILNHPEKYLKIKECIEYYPDCYATRKLVLFMVSDKKP